MTAVTMSPIHIDERGRGSAVVLLHGLPTSVDALELLASALEPKHRVLIPHLPGYGSSPALVPYSCGRVLETLEAALISRGVTTADIIGFSGGAWRALQLAVRRRVEPRALLLLGGLAALSASERAEFRAFAKALRDGADLRPLAGPRFLSSRFAKDPVALKAVEAWVSAISPLALADELDAFAAEPDLLAQLGGVSCPVLLRTGTLDVACPPAKAEAIAASIKGAQLELVPNVAHALLIEDAAETTASALRFLQ